MKLKGMQNSLYLFKISNIFENKTVKRDIDGHYIMTKWETLEDAKYSKLYKHSTTGHQIYKANVISKVKDSKIITVAEEWNILLSSLDRPYKGTKEYKNLDRAQMK